MHKIALERNTPQGDIDRSLYFADESLLKVMKKLKLLTTNPKQTLIMQCKSYQYRNQLKT